MRSRRLLSRSLVLVMWSAAAITSAVACGSFSGAAADGDDAGADAAPGVEGGLTDGAPTPDARGVDDASAPLVPPVELASGFVDLSGIAVTESMVYVAERTPGRVIEVSLAGGSVSQVAGGAGSPTGLAVAGTYLFWCDFGGETISRRPLAGGQITTVHPTPGKASFQIAPASDRIVTVALGAGDIGEAQQFTFDLTSGPSVGGLSNPYDVAVLGGNIYWTESSTGRIGQGKTGDGTNLTFAQKETDCESIAADSSGVYWAKPQSSTIRQAAVGGGGMRDLSTAESKPHSLAADGLSLYWLTSDGKVRRSTHAGGAKTTLAAGYQTSFIDAHVQALALTSQYVVWITTDGRILRVDK